MAHKKGNEIRFGLHIEYSIPTTSYSSIKHYIELHPLQPISPYSSQSEFIWEGKFENKIIKISIPRFGDVKDLIIEGDLPFSCDMDKFYLDLKKIMSSLD